ncbi:MAG: lysophospholipid acyltransferase family protein [Pseudomonadota bacterium]
MSNLKAGVKLARALLHIVIGFFTILLVFPRLQQEQREQRIQVWSARMLTCIGIELRVKGQPAMTGPMLLVANHISWLDITSLHAARFCRFVSKADIKQWPVIGTLAIGVGTLFIERESRRDAMRVVHHMTERLREGDIIGVFPEGTTSDGTGLLPFHANLLQAAITAEVPVQPVSIQFMDRATGQRSPAPCYIDDDTLLESVWRTLRASGIVVLISFGEPQGAQGRDRREWAHALREDVAALRQN